MTNPNVLTDLTAHLLEVARKITKFEGARPAYVWAVDNEMGEKMNINFSDQFARMNDWALQQVQKAAIPAPAYVWAVENQMGNPAEFQRDAQNKADYLESVLLSDGETTPGQRAAATIAITFFETCGVLNDSDVYGSDRAGLVKKCKEFAYGIDRAKEQELDAQRIISEA